MAPTNLDKAVNSRNNVSSQVSYVERMVVKHKDGTAILKPATVDHYLTQLFEGKKELWDLNAQIRLLVPADDFVAHEKTTYDLLDQLSAQYNELVDIKTAITPEVAPIPASSATIVSYDVGEGKLEKYNIPSFDGDLSKWISFRDIFTKAVHDRVKLSDTGKMIHLKSKLTGEALRLIDSLQVSDSNYSIAWDRLNDRYHNKRQLVHSLINRILSQQPIVESANALRDLKDVTNECLAQLKLFGLDNAPIGDAIIMFAVFDKLDATTRQLWEQELKDKEVPSLKTLLDFMEQRASALNAASGSTGQVASKSQVPSSNRTGGKNASGSRAFASQSQPRPCAHCSSKQHYLSKCQDFLSLSVDQRFTFIRTKKLCNNCLGSDHFSNRCRSEHRCRTCSGKHHTLLHFEKSKSGPQVAGNGAEPKVNFNTCTEEESGPPSCDSVLATAVVSLKNKAEQLVDGRTFLDIGATCHYITEACVNRLNLPRHKHISTSTGFRDVAVNTSNAYTSVVIVSKSNPSFNMTVKALIVPRISRSMPTHSYDPKKWPHLLDLSLADPLWYTPQKVDMLLGAEVFCSVLLPGKMTGPTGTPCAISSEFGWLVAGGSNLQSSNSNPRPFMTNCTLSSPSNQELDEALHKFWEVEELAPKKHLTKEEQDCVEHFNNNFSRQEDGRCVVRLPFKVPHPPLGSSFEIAQRRLHSLERRLSNNAEARTEYHKFLQEYEELGHMTQVAPDRGLDTTKCYIPHQFVTKESSTTTKFRVVFDASAKTSNGLSLNDTLMKGPVIQDPLFNIILRFRLHKIAFTADITKMYRQIPVHPDDADIQRILWRDDPSQPVKHFRLNTVTYGIRPSSYQSTACIQRVAEEEKNDLPLAHQVTTEDMFVDDLMSSKPTVEHAVSTYKQVTEMMRRCQMDIRKWSSNSKEFISHVPPENCESKALMIEDPSIKALGLLWLPQQDNFKFQVTPLSEKCDTKRAVLSEIAKLFDPIGWLAPVVIRAKILMQKLWKVKLDWDDKLTQDLQDEWLCLHSDLVKLNNIVLPRFYFTDEPETPSYHLIGFCDASEAAYSAEVFIASSGDSFSCSMVASKTRVAPVKTVSLPRLELCGAVLLADLLSSVKQALQVPIQSITAWTDSTITLDWIHSHPSRWSTFIANRVAHIQGLVPAENWGHVRSEDNPADCASRGISATDLKHHSLWWHGPTWLQDGIPTPNYKNNKKTSLEARQVKIAVHATTTVNYLINNYSSLAKLMKITALVYRFINNCRSKAYQKKPILTSDLFKQYPITLTELHNAKLHWVKVTQQQYYSQELKELKKQRMVSPKSPIHALNPFLDEEGVLRVGGRLRHAKQLSPDARHPILLPHKSHLTQLIILYEHQVSFHGGTQLVQTNIQRKYWITRIRDAVRHVILKCVTCIRFKSAVFQQPMADLPSFRVTPVRAFLKCGVDYGGPFLLRSKNPRSKAVEKGYIALFVCCVTRAIHIEVVSSLSTEDFLAALRRFVSRRGKITDLYSDCGSNFVGGNHELNNFVRQIVAVTQDPDLQAQIRNDQIRFHFNSPASPHHGGLWEAGIKSCKHHLIKIMGKDKWTFEMLTTATAQIEAILNSRPLSPLSSDPSDLAPLTPGHFLIGAPLTAVPEPDLSHIPVNRQSLWQRIQFQVQQFWRRWSVEYLNRLQRRPKWMCPATPIAVGDLVILKEDNLPPMMWKLARVQLCHPGPDGVVRVVTIKTATSEFKRPVVKLSPLPHDFWS